MVRAGLFRGTEGKHPTTLQKLNITTTVVKHLNNTAF